MAQKYLILLFVMEVLISVFIVYNIKKINAKVLFYQEFIDRLQIHLPEMMKTYRLVLTNLNHRIMRRSSVAPMSIRELGFFAGDLLTEIIGLRFPIFGLKKMFGPFGIAIKLWQYRHRLIATFTQKNKY